MRLPYIPHMSKLQRWMNENGFDDNHVAAKVGLSRVQVSRIRRGICGTSPATARKLARPLPT